MPRFQEIVPTPLYVDDISCPIYTMRKWAPPTTFRVLLTDARGNYEVSPRCVGTVVYFQGSAVWDQAFYRDYAQVLIGLLTHTLLSRPKSSRACHSFHSVLED